MVLDLNNYRRAVKPAVALFMENHKDKPLKQLIGSMAIAYSCHIVAVCYFVAELKGGLPEELEDTLKNLCKFYDITEVTGIIT